MDVFEVEDLEVYLSSLSKIFDNVRIVDPFLNKIVDKEGDNHAIDGSSCYKFWDKNIQCKNCISKNAAGNKDTFSKVEYNQEGMFLVIATPVIFQGEKLIVEMIKNIYFIDEIYGEKGEEITGLADVMLNLNEKLIRDELTGSYNRRYINKQLPIDIKYAVKNKENLSAIMLDIDSFKNINDIYGHVVGDLVLKNLTDIIKSKIRKNYDWVARYGGDEFIIMLRNADHKICNKVIKNIQSSLEDKPIIYEDNKVQITISFGGYILKDEEKEFDEILSIIDTNLNIAKSNGKNTLVVS